MQVDFYQLGARTVEETLPSIAQRLIDTGARLLVVSGDAAQLKRIDTALWQARPESFLPHAIAGEDEDAAQPILLSESDTAVNGARNVALADGVWRDAALAFDRAFHLFDGQRVEEARAAWRALAGRDAVERRYWRQDDNGRWEQAG